MPPTRAIHQAARAAYDGLAPRYAALYDDGHNHLMALYRAENLRYLAAVFPPGAHLLEIGSGSGEEACWLAERGFRVTAGDISPRMLQVVRRRREQGGVTDRITTATATASALPFIAGSFGGAYASFGALNTEPDLVRTAAGLQRLLRPGSALVVSAINRWCVWESAWYLAHGRPALAARRWSGAWQRSAVGPDAAAWSRALAARDVARAFQPWFVVEAVHGIGVALPPTYLDRVLARRARLLRRLAQAEPVLARRWPFKHLGDHVRLLLRRTERPSAAHTSHARGAAGSVTLGAPAAD